MEGKKGFTLIEIIAAVIIIGVLALIVVPSVSNYIFNSRNTAYNAHEVSMEEAAKSMTVEVINGKDNFNLPRSGNFTNVTLKELINKELIKSIQDPQSGEKCNEEMSYVIIKAINEDDYEYHACLYCGAYVTDSDECKGVSVDDSTPPVCGSITGESSEWTNKSRTISVGCSDPESSCKKSKYSQTFNTTMESGEVSIYNGVNMETKCPVTVKVDKTKPTCELEIVGDDNIESTGWSSGRNVTVKLKTYSDGTNQSGVATYGMGTSSKNPNYNAKTSYEILNVSGTTTVFGYVKDNAGNEGICYATVTTGLEKPVFDVRYGYQIYPLKERFTTSNVSITDTNKLKTSASGEHTITFNHMNKYTNVTAVIVDLSTEVTDPTSWKLTVGSNSYTAEGETTKRLRFNIETEPSLNNISSSNTYTIKLGSANNKEYTINRIEIEQKNGNIKAKYNVAVNLRTRKQVVRTTRWSWDNGANWDTKYYATYDVRNSAKSGTAKIKNDIPLVSNGVAYSVVKGDGDAPTINISSSNTNWTNQNITLTAKTRDTNTGIIGYMWSTNGSLGYYDSHWNYFDNPNTNELTYTYPVSVNGKYYFYSKDDAGNVSVKEFVVSNIDKLKPTCSAITGQAILSCSDPAKNNDYGQSKIVKYYWGTESNPDVSKFKSVAATVTFTKTETATQGTGSRYYIFVIDEAGNRSDSISDLYYTVTYDKNTGTTPTKTSDIKRKSTAADLTPTSTKTGYTFLGWNTSSTATSALSSYTVNGNVTLYATWKLNDPSTVTITGSSEKIYGSSDTVLTCTQNRSYSSDVTLYYSFGYSTSEGGSPGNWTSASTSNKLTVGKTSYYWDRYYYCRVYAKNSYLTSGTVTSPSSGKQLVRFNNAKITFDKNTGTISGTNPIYVRTGDAKSYTGIRNSTETSNPTASKSCYTFNGWYTSSSGGSQVLKSDGKFNGNNVSGYTNSSKWAATENKSLYAQYSPKTYSISYNLDGGTHGSSHPTGATYDTAFTVNNPSKSVSVSFSLGSSGGSATTTTITKAYTFNGWKITGMDGVTHTYGSSTTTATSISSTKATSFKNLLCNPGTVSFLALWTPPTITLPTVTRTGYTCKWKSDSYEWSSGGSYTPDASGGATSRTMTAVCTPNIYTISLDRQSGSGGTATIYEKYNTGWYSNNGATSSISSITVPSRTGYTFGGYYTSTGGNGTQIINASGTITGSNKSFTSSTTIYAKWTANTYSLSYSLDGGSHGSSHPGSATYDSSFTVNNPSKSVSVSFSLGSSGASATTTTITKSYTFTGWKITGMDGVTHTYGSSTTTATSISSTKATSFKNLRSTSGTVTFSAAWSPPTVTLPTVSRTGYTCKWVSDSYSWSSGGSYTPDAVGGATSRTMTASCTPIVYTITLDKQSGTGGTGTIYEKYNTGWYSNSGATSSISSVSVPSRTGFSFGGYYTSTGGGGSRIINNSGSITGASTSFSSNKSIYAYWQANQLVFNGATYTKDSTTTAQTIGITGASNGTGNYTYTEKSEILNGVSYTNNISISGTTITLNANLPGGTYYYTVTARDTVSGATKDAVFTIKVNDKPKATLVCANATYNGYPQYLYSNATGCASVTNGVQTAPGTYTLTCVPDSAHSAPASCNATMFKAPGYITLTPGELCTTSYEAADESIGEVYGMIQCVSANTINSSNSVSCSSGDESIGICSVIGNTLYLRGVTRDDTTLTLYAPATETHEAVYKTYTYKTGDWYHSGRAFPSAEDCVSHGDDADDCFHTCDARIWSYSCNNGDHPNASGNQGGGHCWCHHMGRFTY